MPTLRRTRDDTMSQSNEHGYCPHCGSDLDGGSIWEHFYHQTDSEIDADRIASQYGATRTKGKWGREIGIYDLEKDRTVSYQCPDCEGVWVR